MAKLTRKQIREVRKQAKIARDKEEEIKNKLIDADLDSDEKEEKERIKKQRKSDKLGFSYEERDKVRNQTIENKTVKVSWNIEVGDLVYLPDSTIGMVVKENTKNIKASKHSHDNKQNLLKRNGKVFVITSSGNNWFYPSKLKKVLAFEASCN